MAGDVLMGLDTTTGVPPVTSISNFDKALTQLVIRTLYEVLRGSLPHVRECIPATFIAGTNGTMRFLSVPDLAVVAGTPNAGTAPWLIEGQTPDADELEFGYEEFHADQAGKLLKLTDKVMKRWTGSLMQLASSKVTTHASATADLFVAETIGRGENVMFPASNVTVGNAAAKRAGTVAANVVVGKDLRRAKASLLGDDVPTYGDGYLRAIIHPDVVFDLEGDEGAGGWIEVQKYASPQNFLSGEVGKYAGIRFIQSSNALVIAGAGVGGVDVYSTVVMGPNAFVFGDWGSIESFITLPGGPGDELHQRAAVGWKGEYGAMIVGEGDTLNGDPNITSVPRYVRIESASGLD